MNILDKIDKLIVDTVVGDVATNTAKGSIDVIGGECPKGYRYDKSKKTCVPISNESSIVGGSYIAGTTTNIVGSGQTRVWGVRRNIIDVLKTKEPVIQQNDDMAKENIKGRLTLRFDSLLGGYVPKGDDDTPDSEEEVMDYE